MPSTISSTSAPGAIVRLLAATLWTSESWAFWQRTRPRP
jgi:hypothetical protein